MTDLPALIKIGIVVAAALTVASFGFSMLSAAMGRNFPEVALAALFLCVAVSMWWQR
jgi:hypothetical protein